MEIVKLLENVQNLHDYENINQNLLNQLLNSNYIQYNSSAIKALKKCLPIEVEYFSKYEENGAIIKILHKIIQLPVSKDWNLYGEYMIYFIQNWMEEITNNLILFHKNWWTFLKILIQLIEVINMKSNVLNEILIQKTAECLLNLASLSQLSVNQKYIVLTCFNAISKHSSTRIRLILKEKIDKYLIKLSTIMASCGDINSQFAIMETLIRWLINRKDPEVRKEASVKWFPTSLYSEEAISIFLNASWEYFYKDATHFLRAHNEKSLAVMSLNIRSFVFGNLILIDGAKNHFLDINSGSKSITLMLKAELEEIIGGNSFNTSLSKCRTLTITEDNITKIQMFTRSTNLVIKIRVVDPLKMYPSEILKDKNLVTIEVSHENKAAQVDVTLRNIFGTKYQDIKPRHRGKLSVYNTRQRSILSGDVQSLKSSVSTSSLDMLKDKLKDIKLCSFGNLKTSKHKTNLSRVTEVSEQESSLADQLINTQELSNSGLQKSHENAVTKVLDINENSVCSILSFAMNTTDDIMLNNAFELEEHDILAQERLNSRKNKNPDVIEDTNDEQALVITKKSLRKKPSEIKTKSNNQIGELQNNYEKNNTFDGNNIENVFSQHLSENKNDGRIRIYPTRTINTTSSESNDSNHTAVNTNFVFHDNDVNDCLGDINNEVCGSLNKIPEYGNENQLESNKVTEAQLQNTAELDINNKKKYMKIKRSDVTKPNKSKNQNIMEQEKQISKKLKQKKQLSPKSEKKRAGTTSNKRESSEIENNLHNGPIIKKRKLYTTKNYCEVGEVHVPENTSQTTTEVCVSNSNVPCEDTNSRRWEISMNEHTKFSKPASSIPSSKMNKSFNKNTDGLEKNISKESNIRNNGKCIYDTFDFSDNSDFETKIIRKKSHEVQRYYNKHKMSDSNKENKNKKGKNIRQHKYKPKQQRKKIIDERVRDAREQLNTSLIIEEKNNENLSESKVVLNTKPSIIPIYNKEFQNDTNKRTKTNKLFGKNENNTSETVRSNRNEDLDNCLPNLVIEKPVKTNNVLNDKECINLLKDIQLPDTKRTSSSSKCNDASNVIEKQHAMVHLSTVNTTEHNNIVNGETNLSDLEKQESGKHSSPIKQHQSPRILIERLSTKEVSRWVIPKNPEFTKEASDHGGSYCNENVNVSGPVELSPININDSPNQRKPDSDKHCQDRYERPRSLRVSIERLSTKELRKSLSPYKINTNSPKSTNATLETPIESLIPKSNHNLCSHQPNKTNKQSNSQGFNNPIHGDMHNKKKSTNVKNIERSASAPKLGMDISVENTRFSISDWVDGRNKDNQNKSLENIFLEIDKSFNALNTEIRQTSIEKYTKSIQDTLSRVENLRKEMCEETQKIIQKCCSHLQRVDDRFKDSSAEIVAEFKKEICMLKSSDERKRRLTALLFREELTAVKKLIKPQKK